MAKHYSEEFKVEAIRMVLEGKKIQKQVGERSGIIRNHIIWMGV